MGSLVAIVIGSQTDRKAIDDSKMLDVLNQCGVIWELSTISDHRHPEELQDYCNQVREQGIRLIIAAAGMAAHLPGAIAANVKFHLVVIGIPLPSDGFRNARDALHSIGRMPSGCPVAMCGVGKAGLKNAAILAVQILAAGEDEISREIRENLFRYFLNNRKDPEIVAEKSQ